TTQNFPPATGGIENLMYSLASALTAEGRSITVFADRSHGKDTADFDRSCNFKIIRYSGIKPWRRRKKARALEVFGKQAEHKPAILIADSWKSLEHPDCHDYSRILCLAHGSELPQQPASSKLLRLQKALSKATYIVANSHYTATQLQAYISDPNKIKVIHPGIDAPPRDAATEQKIYEIVGQNSPILLTIARLEQRKGQQNVIRILPQLIKYYPSLLYVIVGSGSNQALLEKTIKELGINAHVLFTGPLNARYKSAYLANSDLFIMPGSKVGQDVEGFGMAYIESACFGVPAIACDVGGAPEAVLHNQTGLVCAPGDLQQLQAGVRRLLQDQALYERLANNARDRSRKFLWDDKIKEYCDLLDHN
ncbi:MAG: glycosyltransferase family 4 protein, partial [Gammaproteobacteria bacterium]